MKIEQKQTKGTLKSLTVMGLIIGCWMLGVGLARAAEKVTAAVAITNAAGTTNGQTITVNGDVRTWTNNVVVSLTQILTNSTAAGAKTNMYKQIGLSPFVQVNEVDAGSTNLQLIGNSGVTLTVTLSAGWGTVSYSTQTVASAVNARVPFTAETPPEQTNIASGVVAMVGANQNTNVIYETAPAMANFVGNTNNQTIAGKKDFTSGYGSYKGALVTHAPFWLFTSASNTVPAINGVAAGPVTNQIFATPGGWAFASPISLGGNLTIGIWAINGTACSVNANGIFGAGYGVTNLMGTNIYPATISGNKLDTNGLYFLGTNTFPSGSDIAFGRYALTSLASGDNTDIVVGTNVFVEVSGPSAAFTIHGIAGGRNGKLALILNRTGQSMTIANESGVDGTPANRILTSSGGSKSTSGNGAALFIYNASSSRWILIVFDAASSGAGGNPWLITGNQGGISSANFIGTTDTTPMSIRQGNSAFTFYDGNRANIIANSAQGNTSSPNILTGGTANDGCSILGGGGNNMGGGGSQSFNTIANGEANSISNSYDSFVAGESIRMDTKGRTGVVSLRPSIGLGYNWIVQDAGVFVFGDKQQPSGELTTTWIDDAAYFRVQHGLYALASGLNVGWTNMPAPGSIIATNTAVIGTTNLYGVTNVFEVDWTNGQALTINKTNGIVYLPSTFQRASVSGSDATTTGQALVDVTGLTVAMQANGTYEVEAVLSVSTTAVTTGTKYGVQYSAAGATFEGQIIGSLTTTASAGERINALNTATGNAYLTTSGQSGQVLIKGIVTVGANAGNFTIQHLKVTSGTSTVFQKSFLKAIRIS